VGYRDKIAEMVNYFRAVHAVNTAIFTAVGSNLMNEKIKSMLYYTEDIMKRFPDREIYFRPATQIDILNVRSGSKSIGGSSVDVYSIEPYVLKPGMLYAYYYDRVYKYLNIYDPSKERVKWEKPKDLFTPVTAVILPGRIVPAYLADVETPMSIALNYINLKSVLRPEHFKIIEKLWKIYFGDVGWGSGKS